MKNWLQKNLFNTWYNLILTVLSLLLLYWISSRLLIWGTTQADWNVLAANFRLFFAGRYPVELLWRVWLVLGLIVALGGLSWGILARPLFQLKFLATIGVIALIAGVLTPVITFLSTLWLWGILLLFILTARLGKSLGQLRPSLGPWLPLCWLGGFIIALWLLQGGLGLKPVKLDNLSGLILTILTASISIILSFPLGVLLALGRQSQLPVIRYLSITYIELVRGLPLIGILFMAQVMLPLILPMGIRPDRVVRAIAGFTIFSSAYLAENVRGGLQSIPKGQTEAAKALGLNPVLVLALIVLPQALKAVIPSIVGQFISLFKDTSLLAIVGLVDLLGISQSILANPKFIGSYAEVYLFIALIYWLCCYSMSIASRYLEKS